MAVLRTEGRDRTDLALLCPAGTAIRSPGFQPGAGRRQPAARPYTPQRAFEAQEKPWPRQRSGIYPVSTVLAFRGQELIGHWPQPMSDDPKHIGLDDPTYQTFRDAVIYGSCFTGWCLYTWGALLVHLRKSLTTRRMLWLIGIFLLAWLLFVADPGRRFEWWLD